MKIVETHLKENVLFYIYERLDQISNFVLWKNMIICLNELDIYHRQNIFI